MALEKLTYDTYKRLIARFTEADQSLIAPLREKFPSYDELEKMNLWYNTGMPVIKVADDQKLWCYSWKGRLTADHSIDLNDADLNDASIIRDIYFIKVLDPKDFKPRLQLVVRGWPTIDAAIRYCIGPRGWMSDADFILLSDLLRSLNHKR